MKATYLCRCRVRRYVVTRVVDGHFIKKVTLLGGDTEVISIILLYEPAAVRRQRLIVNIDVEQYRG